MTDGTDGPTDDDTPDDDTPSSVEEAKDVLLERIKKLTKKERNHANLARTWMILEAPEILNEMISLLAPNGAPLGMAAQALRGMRPRPAQQQQQQWNQSPAPDVSWGEDAKIPEFAVSITGAVSDEMEIEIFDMHGHALTEHTTALETVMMRKILEAALKKLNDDAHEGAAEA